MMPAYLVIFGAAVRQDGTASESLLRRVEGALRISEEFPGCMFLGTGGKGRYGPAEAEVIAATLIAHGIPSARILIESEARDTLESALNCHAILRNQVEGLVVACSSNYHSPRCAMLLRLLGHQVRIAKMPSDLPHLGWARWIVYAVKELLALPYDIALLLVRVFGRRVVQAARK